MTLTLFCGPSTYQQTIRSNTSASSFSVDTSRATTAAAVWQVDEGGDGGGGMTYEVDYDDDDDDNNNDTDNDNGGGRGPTSLYLAIEAQAWAPIIQFCDTGTWDSGWFWTAQKDPQSPAIQAQTWVTRFEPPDVRHNNNNDGDYDTNLTRGALRLDPPRKLRPPPSPPVIRWSHLPLHAAILFGAPLSVLQALIPLYPASIRCTDDQHSLPLHLAMSVGASDDICLYLAQLFPPALWTKNQQGHWPCQVPAPSPTLARQALLHLCVTAAPAVENRAAPPPIGEDVLIHYQDQVIELKKQKDLLHSQVQSLQNHYQQSVDHAHDLQEQIHQLEAELVTAKADPPYRPPPPQQQESPMKQPKQVSDSSYFHSQLPLQQLQRPPPRQYQQHPQELVPSTAIAGGAGRLDEETRDAFESLPMGRHGNREGWSFRHGQDQDNNEQQPSQSRSEQQYYLPRLPPQSPFPSPQEYHRRRPPQQPPPPSHPCPTQE